MFPTLKPIYWRCEKCKRLFETRETCLREPEGAKRPCWYCKEGMMVKVPECEVGVFEKMGMEIEKVVSWIKGKRN